MATGADGIRPGPLGPVSPLLPPLPVGDVRQEEFNRSLQTMLGREMQAAVLSRYGDGSFLVRVDTVVARMQLPQGTKTGDALQMTLRSLTPRPTFELGAEHGNATAVLLSAESESAPAPRNAAMQAQGQQVYAQQSAITRLFGGYEGKPPSVAGKAPPRPEPLTYSARPAAQNADALEALAEGGGIDAPLALPGPAAGGAQAAAGPGPAGPAGAPVRTAAAAALAAQLRGAELQQTMPDNDASAPAQLSSAGRLIDRVLQTARENGSPTAIIGRQPIVASAAGLLPEQVAAALHDALGQSGVFYESHLREWADGKRSLPDLMREPQAQASPGLGAAQRLPEPVRPLAPSVMPGADAAETPGIDGQAAAAVTLLRGDDGPVAFSQLVNVQLGALEQNAVQWVGHIWPGQQMAWEVRQDPERDARRPGQDGEARGWQSSMRLRFPGLGTVSATIHLLGDAVHVQIHAADAAAAEAMRAGQAALATALEAAGSPMHSFAVKQDERA
jgi:hypothetical protein